MIPRRDLSLQIASTQKLSIALDPRLLHQLAQLIRASVASDIHPEYWLVVGIIIPTSRLIMDPLVLVTTFISLTLGIKEDCQITICCCPLRDLYLR